MSTQLRSLLPLENQADLTSIVHFAQAVERETGEWIGGDQPRFAPALQIDFAIGPPRYRVFYVAATDEQLQSCQAQLLARLETLPVPRVCGLVAFSTFHTWDYSDRDPVTYQAVTSPFGRWLQPADFKNAFDVAVQLYELLSRCHPDYLSPLRTQAVPPWYRRWWHVLSGRPFPAGFLRGKWKQLEIQEPLPYQPSTDWVDQQELDVASRRTIDELKQAITAQQQPMSAYALALKLHEQGAISEALELLAACVEQFPQAAALHYCGAVWSLEAARVEDALRYGQAAIETAPDWAAGYYARGHALMSLEAWEQAETDFSRAAELQPTKIDAWMRLAQVRTQLEKTEPALAAVNEALECDPYSPDALALRIELLPRTQQAHEQPEEVIRRIDHDLTMAHKYAPPHPFFLTRRAERALGSGQPAQTVADCDEALSLDAENPHALGLRGAAYLAMDEIDQAFNDLNRAIDLGNEAPAVLEARGRIHLQRGDLELARLDCEQAIASERAFVVAYLTLAGALLAMEDQAGGFAALQTAAELAPQWDAAHRALGDFHMHQEDHDEAYACFSRALDCDPAQAVNWLQRGTCQAVRGNLADALRDVEKAIDLQPEFPAAHRAKATLNLNRNELDEAIDDLTEVLRLLPDDVVSRFQRAQCLLAKNRPEEARADFDRVIELCPTLAAAYSGRGCTWIDSGDEQRAADDFREATIQDPLSADDFEISRVLAEAAILQRAEDYVAALAKIEEALEINQESAQARSIRAACYWHDEQFVEAIEDYTWLLERTSHDEEDRLKRLAGLNNRGHVYVEMGEFEKGLADLDQAVQLGESFGSRECQAYSLSARALAFAGLNEPEKANADFRRSVEIRPENAWVYYNQGLVYDKFGNSHEAAVCFNLALTLDEPPLTPRKRQRAQAYVQRQAEADPG